MDGFIVLENPEKNRYAIRTKIGRYIIFELLGESNPIQGDFITGKLTEKGITKLVNLSQKVIFTAKITETENLVASKAKQSISNRT